MSVLYYDGADSSLAERLGAFFLPFEVRPRPADSRLDPLDSLFLLRFPDSGGESRPPPGGAPFIGFGEEPFLAAAFAAGARDYLREPWAEEELVVRTARALGVAFVRDGTGAATRRRIELEGRFLSGDLGRSELGPDEARVLNILLAEAPGAVSRVALRRAVWPAVDCRSRVVDETISRLRRRIAEVSGREGGPQISSIRGFGYAIRELPRLWAVCG